MPAGGSSAALAGLGNPSLPQQVAFTQMGLALPGDFDSFRQSLANYPAHVYRVLRLNAGLTNILSSDSITAADRIGLIADTLGANGAATMVLLNTTAGLVLVVASIGLPQIGTNIGPRRSSDFFWGGTVISGGGIRLQGQGTRTLIKALGTGVYAASVLAYSRIGATDPFEWRVTLPPDKVLTHPQYEILMNMLERMFPVGVEINTWTIRRQNVALDGTTAHPLSPRLSRSYRPFRRARFLGTGSAPVQPKT